MYNIKITCQIHAIPSAFCFSRIFFPVFIYQSLYSLDSSMRLRLYCSDFKIPLASIRCTASAIASSSCTSAIRTCPYPDGPNALPGVTRTPVFSNNVFTNSIESLNPAGIGAQTNIVPSGFSIFHPIDARPSHRQSRRLS